MKEKKLLQEYVYPAVFHANDDNTYTIIFPDLPGCISEGKSLGNAMKMAEAALTQWIEYLKDSKEEIPAPSKLQDVELENNEFVNFIRVDIKDTRAVKRTISLPRWMDEQAAEEGLSLSKILQEALSKRFVTAN